MTRNRFGRGSYHWGRRQTHHSAAPDPAQRADALADLLGRVLDSFAFTVEEHGGCGSCATDLAIFRDKAQALGCELSVPVIDPSKAR